MANKRAALAAGKLDVPQKKNSKNHNAGVRTKSNKAPANKATKIKRMVGKRDKITNEEYGEFVRSCPGFERTLARSGRQIITYWFSVSDEEQNA